VSAQVIAALRKRAILLDAEVARIRAEGISETPDTEHFLGRDARTLAVIAQEFRDLALEAEFPSKPLIPPGPP
jgi:hypothetical protein